MVVFFKGCPLWCKWCSNPELRRPIPRSSGTVRNAFTAGCVKR
nr:hypothetical protein [Lacrimispora indolis]